VRTVDNILAVGLKRDDLHVNGEVKLFIFITSILPAGTALGACPSQFTVMTLSWHRIRQPAAARLLGLRVRIMSVSYECCVLSGKGLCVGLITRPEESYRLC